MFVNGKRYAGYLVRFSADGKLIPITKLDVPIKKLPCYRASHGTGCCLGRGMAACATCVYWACYNPLDLDPRRVNPPLRPDELRHMDGQPVYAIRTTDRLMCWVVWKNDADSDDTWPNYGVTWWLFRYEPDEQTKQDILNGFWAREETGSE